MTSGVTAALGVIVGRRKGVKSVEEGLSRISSVYFSSVAHSVGLQQELEGDSVSIFIVHPSAEGFMTGFVYFMYLLHIRAHRVCMCESVTVFITKGSCQDHIEVPGVVKARLASSPWQRLTQQPCCATQHRQVKQHKPSDPDSAVML